MLQTQVNYWAYMENKRHNLAQEEQARNELTESIRHNVIGESFNRYNLAETKRHNRVAEQQGFMSIAEQRRSHEANEQIGRVNANTNRLQANIAATKMGFDNINTQYANRTNRMNAYTNQANSLIREGEYILKKKQYNLDEAALPARYIQALLPGLTSLSNKGNSNVVRRVTKTITKTKVRKSK